MARSDASPLSGYWVRQELRRVVEEEQVMRAKLWAQGEWGWLCRTTNACAGESGFLYMSLECVGLLLAIWPVVLIGPDG